MHRESAIEKLKGDGMGRWERDLVSRAVERSGGVVPSLRTDEEREAAETEGLYALGLDDEDEDEDEVGAGSSRWGEV
jgi:hypothetical protein